MRMRYCLVLLAAAGLWAQAPPQPTVTLEEVLRPEAVVAEVDGKPVTYGELQAVLKSLGPEASQAALADRQKFVHQYGMLRRLAELAEKDKLDQRSPYKEAIAYSRMQVLYQATINEKFDQLPVTPQEEQKFYAENKERFTQAKVRVIYIAFSATPPPQTDPKAKKVLNEAEAKAKAEDLLKQIRAGADFVKLVKEHSDDATSAEKGGDFGAIRKTDKIPEAIKAVIFSLKPGEVGGPVQQPNGFYLFRVEEVSTDSFERVRETIFTDLKNQRFMQWMDSLDKSIAVKPVNQGFFAPKQMPLNIPQPK